MKIVFKEILMIIFVIVYLIVGEIFLENKEILYQIPFGLIGIGIILYIMNLDIKRNEEVKNNEW